jgi:large subunit ribosomal protein L1
MDKSNIQQAVAKALEDKGKKNFSQTVDLIVNLKEIDLKKNDQQVDVFVTLPHQKGKAAKVCGLVGPELFKDAKANLDDAIEAHDFDTFKNNPKKIKKLSDSYDFFVAQANVMPQIATVFGRVLGPRGKMPNPKAGCVLPPKAATAPLKERLERTVRVVAKTSLSIKVPVGTESQSIDEIVENIEAVFTNIINSTPQGENNVRNVMVKLTMGAPVRVN